VVDCDVNPRNPVIGGLERSFSSCPQTVARHALEAIRAHCNHGVISVLKHFPGHGSSSQDSHEGFVDVTRTWSTLELEPYETIISTGLCEAVMTAHIFNARLDPRFPATLSHSIVTGILRRKLGYDGVVFSDDMQMKAISDHYGLETAVGLAIEAGVDVLLFGNNLAFDEDLVPNLLETLKGLVSRGHVRRERIHESFQRIMKLKEPLFHIPERLTIL
jgi:beta-N-acetylhexosaminidase